MINFKICLSVMGVLFSTSNKANKSSLYYNIDLEYVCVCVVPTITVNILLKNVRNDQQKDFSNFKVDSLSDIMVLFSSPLDVVPRQEEDS